MKLFKTLFTLAVAASAVSVLPAIALQAAKAAAPFAYEPFPLAPAEMGKLM